jgi:hypothetical protein
MSLIVKIGKKGKRLVKKLLPEEKRQLSYTRRSGSRHSGACAP